MVELSGSRYSVRLIYSLLSGPMSSTNCVVIYSLLVITYLCGSTIQHVYMLLLARVHVTVSTCT